MVTVTELNRAPNITVDAIDAASVSASESLTDPSGDTHTGELADRDGDDLTPNTVDFATSITDAEGNTVTSLSDPVRVTEEAVTFEESGVDLTLNKTRINNNRVELGTAGLLDGSTVQIDGGEQGSAVQAKSGFQITPNTSLAGIKGRLVAPEATTAYLTNEDSGEQIATQDISSLNYEDIVAFQEPLSSGTAYTLSVDADGSDYQKVRTSVGGSFTSSDFDLVGFYGSGTDINNFDLATALVEEPASNGDCVISFQESDKNSWDIVAFERLEDGGTVTVDIEDSAESVIKSDISTNNDISDIPASTDVHFRVSLSRSDTSSNPSLSYIALRYTL